MPRCVDVMSEDTRFGVVGRGVGADGLAIAPQGLAIDCATLQAAIEVRVAAAR